MADSAAIQMRSSECSLGVVLGEAVEILSAVDAVEDSGKFLSAYFLIICW